MLRLGRLPDGHTNRDIDAGSRLDPHTGPESEWGAELDTRHPHNPRYSSSSAAARLDAYAGTDFGREPDCDRDRNADRDRYAYRDRYACCGRGRPNLAAGGRTIRGDWGAVTWEADTMPGAGLSRLGREAGEAPLLAALHLDTSDQAAIVTFNAEATLLQTLTSSESDLHAALDRIATAPQTRIHRGIEVAAAELASPRRAAGHTPVMVLLTDGRANPEGPEFAVAEADTAKRAGVTVFTVGLGDDLDHEALRAMASRPEDYHHAPDAEQLAEIYRAIAVTIPCPSERFWGLR